MFISYCCTIRKKTKTFRQNATASATFYSPPKCSVPSARTQATLTAETSLVSVFPTVECGHRTWNRPLPFLSTSFPTYYIRWCTQKFPDWVDNEICTLTCGITRWEATQRVM